MFIYTKNKCLREIYKYNKKFWEELIAYFPLKRHGQHKKRRLQQFLVAAGTCLPSRCLLKIEGYTHRPIDFPLIRHGPHRKWRGQQLFYFCVCILCRGDVFTDPLPSNINIHRLRWGIYEVRRWDGRRCHDIYTKFHKNCFRHSKVNRGFTDTQHGDLTSLLLFFKIRKAT
jgi:hypothetical protein